MKIVFFGTADFALPALRALVASPHTVALVVTQPDRERGRNLTVSPPPSKVIAAMHAIPVFQPADVSSAASVTRFESVAADLFVVIAFGQLLKNDVLKIPKSGAINLHGSLLPKYRGAAPTNRAIINGETTTGVTVIRMDERMDAGDIIAQRDAAIDDDDTNITLSETLSEIGADLLIDTIAMIESGRATFRRQDEAQVTYAPKLKKGDGLIDWDEPARLIHNKVRGFIPWPGAYTRAKGKVIKIWETRLLDDRSVAGAKSGELIDLIPGKGMVVNTGSGTLIVTCLQAEGKKILDAEAFLRGFRIAAGCRFGT